MGTNVDLRVANFSIYVGRNGWYEPLGELFQERDLMPADDHGEEPAFVMRKPFMHVLQRLRLLGISDESVRREFAYIVETNALFSDDGDDDEQPSEEPAWYDAHFADFARLIAAIDISSDDDEHIYTVRHGYEAYFKVTVAPRAGLTLSDADASSSSEVIDYLSAYSLLWLLSKNPANVQYDVTWDFAEHVQSGWSTTEEHVRAVLRRHRFLIVTEGTSDAAILERALAIRRPAVADFFYSYDLAKEKFPYGGHSNLRDFCRAMVTISILNQTIVVFDNDAVGLASAQAAMKMPLPDNVRVLPLPDLPVGTLFTTIGTDGPGSAEINGRAASIEAYLDLRHGPAPVIRWTNFERPPDIYQGSLEQKQVYARHFYDLKEPYERYDFSHLDLVLDAITEEAMSIAQARVRSVVMGNRGPRVPLS